MKPSDRVKFLKLRRRADALELRALDAERRGEVWPSPQ